MFRASLCPSSGEQDRVLLRMVFCTGCAGCGCMELGPKLCALCGKLLFDLSRTVTSHTVRTAHDAAPQDHSQPHSTHPGRTLHAAGHGLILLMMCIMMPETCWDRKFDNRHRISCILLVLSLHLKLFAFGAVVPSDKEAFNTAHGIWFSGGTDGIKILYLHFWLGNCTAAFSKDLSNNICVH